MELTVIEQNDELSHVALKGRLDLEGVQAVQMKFLGHTASRRTNAIVDISGLDFIASMGMGMLIDAARSLKRDEVKLVLVGPQPMVLEALKNGAIDRAIDVVDTMEDAKALCAA